MPVQFFGRVLGIPLGILGVASGDLGGPLKGPWASFGEPLGRFGGPWGLLLGPSGSYFWDPRGRFGMVGPWLGLGWALLGCASGGGA